MSRNPASLWLRSTHRRRAFFLAETIGLVMLACSVAFSDARADEVEDLIQQLNSGDPNARAKASESLGNLGEKAESAIPALIDVLGDQGSYDILPPLYFGTVQTTAATALVKIGPASVPAVIDALQNSTNRALRIGAARTLFYFGPAANSALPVLIATLTSEDGELREYAVLGVGAFGERAADQFDRISRLLRDDPSVSVRRQSAAAIRRIDPTGKRAIPELIQALGDESPEVRSAVVITLGAFGTRALEAVPALKARLEDRGQRSEMLLADVVDQREVRLDVAEALDKICGGNAFRVLVQGERQARPQTSAPIPCECFDCPHASRRECRAARKARRCR